jgi:sporulation protein YlmC with PRC-barrel domain
MMLRITAVVLTLFLACIARAPCFAAEPAAEPQMRPGYTAAPAATPTVALTADQILASQAIGTQVRDANGSVVATIGDLLINSKDTAVEVAVLDPAGGASFKNGRTTVAWQSLKFEGKPTPLFTTALSAEALASGVSFKGQAKASNAYYDVKADLIGKKAVGAGGADLGKIEDVVLTFGNGRLVALIIDTGGLLDVGIRHRVVAWERANPQGGKAGAPVRLALSKSQVDSAPIITTMAPSPAPAQSGNGTPMISRDSAGNISGSRVPAPPTRR